MVILATQLLKDPFVEILAVHTFGDISNTHIRKIGFDHEFGSIRSPGSISYESRTVIVSNDSRLDT